jgi:tRNA pseudouridine38-40 synthase
MTGEAHPLRRVLLTVAYDGTGYSGWQRQLNAMSVQQRLEEALQKALGKKTGVTGASRTDAGVHALCQMVHFDTDCTIPDGKFPFVLNNLLPCDIRVTAARPVPDGFHARFSCRGKTYTYRMHNAPHASAIFRNITCHVPVHLDETVMDEAAKRVIGTYDFKAFAAAGGSAKTTIRTITQTDVTRQGDRVTLTVSGNAFLYNMVRILAGTLMEIGQGSIAPQALSTALATGDRLALGPTAPPQGLELTRVEYDI